MVSDENNNSIAGAVISVQGISHDITSGGFLVHYMSEYVGEVNR